MWPQCMSDTQLNTQTIACTHKFSLSLLTVHSWLFSYIALCPCGSLCHSEANTLPWHSNAHMLCF